MADTPEPAILSEVALFRGLPPEQLSKIGARLRRRTFPASTNVITAEEPGETVYVVLEGSVKVYMTRPEGTEVILAALGRIIASPFMMRTPSLGAPGEQCRRATPFSVACCWRRESSARRAW